MADNKQDIKADLIKEIEVTDNEKFLEFMLSFIQSAKQEWQV